MGSPSEYIDDQLKKMTYLSQIFGAFVICLGNLNLGGLLGYPTKAIKQWKNESNVEVNLNDYEGSLFASLFWMVGVFCAPIGGFISGWLGRKKIVIIAAPMVACGWLIIGLAQNKIMLYVGRIVTAAAVMLYSASMMPYISETVHPSIRGSLTTLPAFMMAGGMLMVWIIGYFLTWRMTAFVLAIPPVLLTLFMLMLPETPYWLIENNEVERAKKSLQFFRGPNYDITEELREIELKHESKKKQNSNQSWKFTIQRIFSSAFFKPFSCIGILYIINTWSGFNCLLVYMISILDESGSNIDPNVGPIIVGSCRVAFAGMAPFFIRQFCPKTLFVITSFLTSLAMITIGTFAFLQKFYPDLPHLELFSWIPLAMVIVPVIMRAAGILPVLHSLLSEVFPTDIRTQSIGLVQGTFLATGALSVQFFPQMKSSMSLHGLLFMYGASGLASCIWGLKTIPDNRGKSLIKVEEMYEQKRDTDIKKENSNV